MEALALDLKGRLDGHAIAKIHLAAFSALKTFDPPSSARRHARRRRHPARQVPRHRDQWPPPDFHLARAGWIRWKDEQPPVPPRPNSKSGLAVRVVLDDQSGLDVTEAGTKKSLAAYVVAPPQDVPGIASLGPDPLDDAFTREILANILEDAGRAQIKGVLRHQGTIAGIGNAYSDEILHAAKMSPFKPANSLTADGSTSCSQRSRTSSATPSSGLAAFPRASSRVRRRPTWRCTAAPARRARCAATSSARSASPTRRCSTAPPARPAASRWQTAGCRAAQRASAGAGMGQIPTAASRNPGPTARRPAVLDVREDEEWAAGHVGAPSTCR